MEWFNICRVDCPYRIAQFHNTGSPLVLILMKEDSAIEEIFGRFRLFRQDAYHDDEDLDACWPVAADGIGRLRFVKVMLP